MHEKMRLDTLSFSKIIKKPRDRVFVSLKSHSDHFAHIKRLKLISLHFQHRYNIADDIIALPLSTEYCIGKKANLTKPSCIYTHLWLFMDSWRFSLGVVASQVHDYTNRGGVEAGKEPGWQAISCTRHPRVLRSYSGYYERHALRIYLPTFPRDIPMAILSMS